MRVLIETRWFTIDISTPQPEKPPTVEAPTIQASGNGSYELSYPERIGFTAPLQDHPEGTQ